MAATKVLIIDDEPDSCLILSSFLEHLHYDVYTAQTLLEGFDLFTRISPNIVFLDNNLPDGLGWNRLDDFREQSPGIKIYLISAYGFDYTAWNSRNVEILEKPLSLAKIRSLL